MRMRQGSPTWCVFDLVDMIMTCVTHFDVGKQIFLVFNGEGISITKLLRRTRQVIGPPERLTLVLANCVKLASAMVGKQDMAPNVCGSLQVAIGKTRRLWSRCPPLTLDQGLKKVAEGFGA